MGNIANNQSWLDVSIQQTGTLENLFAIAEVNDISVTDVPVTGMAYIVPDGMVNDIAALAGLVGVVIGTNGN